MRALLLALLLCSISIQAQPMQSPKSECEYLMNEAVPFAERMLERHHEFFPYAMALKIDGKVASVASYDGREQPPSADVIRQLKEGLRNSARAGEYLAAAIVYDVRVQLPSSKEKSDAIAVQLEHRDHYSVMVYLPYRLEVGKLIIGEPFASEGRHDVFPAK
jgi:hypothetical protein